jgi:IclR family mhp operon transcriptional activator
MESTRPIRALMRGFDALTVLNLRDGATVSEVAQEIRLPRTTAYRILETLCNSGFVLRDPADDRYRLTVRVKALSSGFTDEAWVTQIAAPRIIALCDELVWPVSLATLAGSAMMLRETTDHATPLAGERFSAGMRLPLLSSSAGRAYLACCPPAECENLLDHLAQLTAHSNKEDAALARGPRAELLRTLAAIRHQGYAMTTRTHRMVEETSLSAPVMARERILATLTVRFAASAVPARTVMERFLPKLHQTAAMIAEGFLNQTDGADATP